MEKNQKDMIDEIIKAFEKYTEHQAFVINNITYTYRQLPETVYRISALINSREDKIIGIIAEDKLETYASILAVLISGKTYVILHPAYPRHRNRKITELADIHLILYTKDIRVLNLDTEHVDFICTSELQEVVPSSSDIHPEKNENAYIIFTSGSTGEPKGVPISRNNLNAFYNAYSHLDWQLDENDRMLQMFELTFDVSIVSFLFPLTIGACIYTVSPEGVKYINVIETLEKYNLTFAAVAPSLLQLLLPYFSEIQLPELKYLIVTAEASDVELLSAFRACAPNASFVNLYGPTEGTIYCTAYRIPTTSCKHHNGMIAIGKPFEGVDVLIMDNNGSPVATGETGELWISGRQVMNGYWNAPEKTKECLIEGKHCMEHFPLNTSSKTDRKRILELI